MSAKPKKSPFFFCTNDDGKKVKGYKRLDNFDDENNYYCTKGNDCTWCRYAPHAKSKDDCRYVVVERRKK